MDLEESRRDLVSKLIKNGYLSTKPVINAMLNVPRELFLPEDKKRSAYIDRPLTIGHGQTISAPHMNAMMCEALDLSEGLKLLEIGTGSGYHAALCAYLIAPEGSKNPGHIYTVERIETLAKSAEQNIKITGFSDRIDVIHADGTLGYEAGAPYDRILVTAASPLPIPQPLKDQLKDGGIMCIPAGSKNYTQNLYLFTKKGDEFKKKSLGGVRFVPLVGEHGFGY